jgi:hypothetical protein
MSERGIVKLLRIFVGVPLAFALTSLSVPWILWSLGAMVGGCSYAADRAIETCPLYVWLEWVDR